MALTEKQIAAADALADGMPIKDALALAGYKDIPMSHGRATREMKDKTRRSIESRLLLDLAPRAIALYRKVIDDEQAPLKVRAAIAKDILERSGFVPPKAADAASVPSLEDMTRDELVAFINQANERRAEIAKPVNTSDDAAAQAQLSEMLK